MKAKAPVRFKRKQEERATEGKPRLKSQIKETPGKRQGPRGK